MRIHSDYLTIQTKNSREFMNITDSVKDAADKSGIRDGFILICPLHSNSAVLINDEEAGLLQDIDEWLASLAPKKETYHHNPRSESNASAHLQSLLLNPQVVVAITEGKLELGPWQQVIYAELDGQRPKRILIKVFGD